VVEPVKRPRELIWFDASGKHAMQFGDNSSE
jgi:hypothetical protein